ncbi:MAG TPA: cytochrome oxidase subunit III [Gemmatimonadetes bacterium]|jgi:cytochrome c oxidase subunit 3|nr:cytochrome oxidase subunit III [Gemmatimonadota bacterium]
MQHAHGAVGEERPYGVSTKKLVMWLFIIADGATFGALLFAYGYVRVGSPDWTKPFAFSPTILNAIVMTFVLLTSSLTMLGGVRAASAGRPSAIRWLSATMLLGTGFAALHLREWFSMIHEGWSPSHNPLGGSPLFGAAFFGITGLHLLHVVSGVIAIGVVTLLYRRGRLDASYIETTGLYWHFVDLVWMFVFPLVYLLNAR